MVQRPDDQQLRFDHTFVIIPNSQFNLFGRDLMYRLGCKLTFGGEGFTIQTPSSSFAMVCATPTDSFAAEEKT